MEGTGHLLNQWFQFLGGHDKNVECQGRRIELERGEEETKEFDIVLVVKHAHVDEVPPLSKDAGLGRKGVRPVRVEPALDLGSLGKRVERRSHIHIQVGGIRLAAKRNPDFAQRAGREEDEFAPFGLDKLQKLRRLRRPL